MTRFPAQAFRVRYCGPTDHHGARMVAVDALGRCKRTSFDPGLTDYQNAREAAIALSYACGWGRPIEMVGASDRGGWVFIATGWESGVATPAQLMGHTVK